MVSAKALDWAGWTKTEKPWDRDRPFHRINSPTMKEPAEDTPDKRISGHGYQCGCLIPDDIPQTLLEAILSLVRDPRNLIRTAPSWVPVKLPRKGVDQNKIDYEPWELEEIAEPQEVEGVILRSYQTWTDYPLIQWHYWYDWNFMLFPAPGYGYLRGGANTEPNINPNKEPKDESLRDSWDAGFTQIAVRDFDHKGADTMECEFDCGLFGSRWSESRRPESFGPMFEADWAWPMVGQYLWARGRWVYDCGHPTDPLNPKHPQDVKKGPNAGKTRSELHPCMALATARWEAVKFVENGDYYVPAIQFMFFATRLGGYVDAEHVGTNFPEKDIEFIVDLPELTMRQGPFPVGHTPKFAHNTIQLPQLLIKVEHDPFFDAVAKTDVADQHVAHKIDPIVEPIRPKDDPTAPPRQVKVTIPFDTEKKRPNGEKSIPVDDHYYGVIISLGWFDPDLSQARRVKKVKVTIDKFKVALNDHGFLAHGSRAWQVRAGVNGRWVQAYQKSVQVGSEIPLKKSFVFYLADDDAVSVAAHGEETWSVHEQVYRGRTDAERVLMIPTQPFRADRKMLYFQDCMREDHALARTIVSAMEGNMWTTGANENLPIGRIDPYHRVHPADKDNPMPIALVKGKLEGWQSGLPSREVGHLSELAERPVGISPHNPEFEKGIEYLLLYTIESEPQIKET